MSNKKEEKGLVLLSVILEREEEKGNRILCIKTPRVRYQLWFSSNLLQDRGHMVGDLFYLLNRVFHIS